MKFRQDINGLRAIAVIAVVFFHFNNEWLSGGFAGVDVFFVISGFLMTSIIFKGLENNSFSIVKFYIARANRIVPALAFLCFALLIFGWFFLYNSEYQNLGLHIKDSLYFISNHTYWLESGYFDAGSHEKWLLHTWSLSAEWQFYIIYPLALLILSYVFSINFIKKLLLIAALLGFAFCVIASLYWPDAAYFLLPTRAWQMLAGGLAFLYPIDKFNGNYKIELTGLALVLFSYFYISSEDLWPGYLSILPVLGAFLIIQSNNTKSKITRNVCLQKIGLWSYSIYLWHWPIVVYIYTFIDNINNAILMAGIGLSVVLGFISFSFIEKTNHKVIKYTVFILTLFSAYYVIQSKGVDAPVREISQYPVNDFVLKYKNYYKSVKKSKNASPKISQICSVSRYFGKHGKLGVDDICIDNENGGGVLLWGDSHMEALAYGIKRQLPEGAIINQIASSGCPSSFLLKQGDISRLRRACDYANELALSTISANKPEIVIIANKDNHQAMDWTETVARAKELGVKQIVLVGPVPQWYPSLPLVYAKKSFGKDILASHKLDKNVVKTNDKMIKISQKIPGLTYIDVMNEICEKKEGIYHCKVIYDDVLLAWDYGHLTHEGSNFVAKNIVMPKLIELKHH